MRHGVHLPQFGRAATAPQAIPAAARAAENLGFDDVWVSDHQVVPASQAYPPPQLCEPLMSLAFAAAATERVGLGTSVLVAPQYPSPLAVANALATLDVLSGGRLTVALGLGWSAAEYAALQAPFDHRGARLEEIVALFRTVWNNDPATHQGRFYSFEDIRLLPKPAHPIDLWIGGRVDAARRRAARIGDGFHGIGISAEEAARYVAELRSARPEENFTVSIRLQWDQRDEAPATVADTVAAYEAAGVDHVVVTCARSDPARFGDDLVTLARALGL